MPILNYTTKINVNKTVSEIHEKLAEHGARKIMFDYDAGGKITAICFQIDTPDGLRGIKLAAKAGAVYKVMEKQNLRPTKEQAERVAWRILKDLIEAQMAYLDSEQAEMDEIFFAGLLKDNDQTLYEAYRKNQLMLESGMGNED